MFNTDDYYFCIDSSSVESVNTRLYGYAVTEQGIIDDSNLDSTNMKALDGCGTYVLIERNGEEVTIRQDYFGDFGLFVYQDDDYFAISNSFFVLLDHLKYEKRITLNVDYVNQFLATWIVGLAYAATPIKEISRIPANGIVRIDANSRRLSVELAKVHPNEIPLRSSEGMAILDRWYRKWINIVRSISTGPNHIRCDLSGGFDSRFTFLFLVKSGCDWNRFFIHSLRDGLHTHEDDLKVSTEIANHYGFKLNAPTGYPLDFQYFSKSDILEISFHTKMMFQKELSFPDSRSVHLRFAIGGYGGELLRPYWNMPPEAFVEKQCSAVNGYGYSTARELRTSIARIIEDSFEALCEKYSIESPDSGYYSFNMFRDCYSRNHFGRINVESIVCNLLRLSPLVDPQLQKLRLDDDDCPDQNLLYAVVFERYCKELLDFRFEGNRKFDEDTLAYARLICEEYPFEEEGDPLLFDECVFSLPPSAFTENRTPDSNQKVDRKTMEKLFFDVYESHGLREEFCSQFSSQIYERAGSFALSEKYYPLRHVYSVVGASEIVRAVRFNEQCLQANRISGFYSYFNYRADTSNKTLQVKLDDNQWMRIDITSDDPKESLFEIVSMSDPLACIEAPGWLRKSKFGYVIQSKVGMLDVSLRAKKPGTITFHLRSRDTHWRSGERKCNWVAYDSFSINNKPVFDEQTPIWHNKPYTYSIDVTEREDLHLHLEWRTDIKISSTINADDLH